MLSPATEYNMCPLSSSVSKNECGWNQKLRYNSLTFYPFVCMSLNPYLSFERFLQEDVSALGVNGKGLGSILIKSSLQAISYVVSVRVSSSDCYYFAACDCCSQGKEKKTRLMIDDLKQCKERQWRENEWFWHNDDEKKRKYCNILSLTWQVEGKKLEKWRGSNKKKTYRQVDFRE